MLSCCTNHHLPGQLENDVVKKKQAFSIPVKDRTPEQMLSLVKGAIQRLTSGEDKESVKAWARA